MNRRKTINMDNKTKIGGLCLLILIIAIIGFATTGTQKTNENTTMKLADITFTTPVSHNNTTNEYKTPTGGTTYAYEDYENNVSVYVCTERDYNYDLQERYDSVTGFSQMRPVGDYWFIVCADRADDKSMVYNSAHIE